MNKNPTPRLSEATGQRNKILALAGIIFGLTLAIFVLAFMLDCKKSVPADTSQDADLVLADADAGIIDAISFLTVEEFLDSAPLTSSQIRFIREITDFEEATVDSDGNHLTRLSSVSATDNPNILYTVHNSFDGRTAAMQLYRMTFDTDKTEALFTSEHPDVEFDLAGLKDSKLLFFKMDPSDSPGPCSNIWTYAYEHPLPRSADDFIGSRDDYRTLQTLDLGNIGAGMRYTAVPQDKYETEKKAEEKCDKDFDEELQQEQAAQQE